MFEQHGFHDTRVTDISQAAVAHGTFYTYFDSKLDVFRDVLMRMQHDSMHAVRSDAARRRPRRTGSPTPTGRTSTAIGVTCG